MCKMNVNLIHLFFVKNTHRKGIFATSGGSGFGNTVKELQSSASDAVITEGRLLNCGTKQEISEWVNSL